MKNILIFILVLIASTVYSQVVKITVDGKSEGLNVAEVRTIRYAADGTSIIFYGDAPGRLIFCTETPNAIMSGSCGVLFAITAKETVNGNANQNVPLVLNRQLVGRVSKYENNYTAIDYWKPPSIRVVTAATIGSMIALMDNCAESATGDDWGAQAVTITGSTLDGDGTPSDPLKVGTNGITSNEIAAGTILMSDIGQNGASSGQVIKWNGSAWAPAADDNSGGGGADNWGSQVVITSGGTLSGNGTSGSPLFVPTGGITTTQIANATISAADLNQMGAGGGQVMKWNGSAWVASDVIAAGSITTGSGLVGDGTVGNPLDWAGGFSTSPVTGSGTSLVPFTIASNSITTAHIATDGVGTAEILADNVTNAKLADMPANTIKGAIIAGNPVDLTVAEAKTMLNLSGTNSGDQIITLSGDVTGSGTGAITTTIANNAVTNVKMADDAIGAAEIINGVVDSTEIAQKGISMRDIAPEGATSGQVMKWNGNMWLPSTDVSGGTPALVNTHIFVGNASNIATDVAMSQDATISNTGAVTVTGATSTFALKAEVSASVGADLNNAAATLASVYSLTTTVANINVGGFTAGTDGRMLYVRNEGTNSFNLLDEAAGSTASNRLDLPGNATYIVYPGEAVLLWYNFSTSRWNVLDSNTSANLSIANNTATTLDINSNTGTDATIPAATGSLAGLQTAAGKTKENFISVTQAVDLDAIESASHPSQTITNTSDATSHTGTLSNTGGSLKLVEGANITLTTSGTGADGIVTIASTGGGGATDLTVSGASSPLTLNSSTGTDVTVTAGTGISLAGTSGNMTITNTGIITEVDGSTSNEVLTISDGTDTEALGGQTLIIAATGIVTRDYVPGTNTLTIGATEVDGSTTNENLTITDGTNSENMGGQTLTVTASGGAAVTYTPATNTLNINAGSSSGGDNWGSQVVQPGSTLSGQGIIGNLLNVATGGITAAELATGAVDLASGDVTGIVPIANGGSGQSTAQLAMNAFAGGVTSGSYLRGNGTNVVLSAIQIGDVPSATGGDVTGLLSNLQIGSGVVGSAEVTDNSIAAGDLAVNVVSSIDGVTNDGADVDFIASGAITITPNDAANTVTFTVTEVDGSVSNELQTIANTSDATSHTGTLSNTGGSIKFVEGANITLTTSGTGLDGIITIASTGSGATNLAVTGTSSPLTLTSDTGTDVTFSAGSGTSLTGTGSSITIAATDPSLSNEGSLTVVAGGANDSGIQSNTSGSTNVVIAGSSTIGVSESGSTITVVVPTDGITATQIATDAVNSAEIIADAVGTAEIANNAVTNAKLADVATQTFKGRTTAATGDPEDLTIAQAKTMLNLTGTNSGDQTITLTGDVTGSGTGSFAATIADNSVDGTDIAFGSDLLGDIPYYNGTDLVRLPGNTTTTKQFLTQTGTGAVSAAPGWGALAQSDIPAASGGDVTGLLSNLQIVSGVVGSAEVTDNSLAAGDLAVNVISSIEGVDNDGGNVDLIGAGILAITSDNTANTVTFTATEVDGSTSNELQTIANTSDATSHTVTLSNSGGTIQFIEGTNVTFTTGGTSGAGTLTINASGGGAGTDLAVTGTSSPLTLTSSTGTDVTVTGAGIVSLSSSGTNIAISATEVDGSVTNEAQAWTNSGTTTWTGTLASAGGSGGGSTTIQGLGIVGISHSAGTISITGTEVDGAITNEGSLTVSAGTGTTSVIGSNTSGSTAVTLSAAGALSISEAGNTITLTATEVDGSLTNEAQTWTNSGTTTWTGTLGTAGGAGGGSTTIQGLGIVGISHSAGTISITGTEVDGAVTNEGSLSVTAGGGNDAVIASNTSGGTGVTISGGANITITENTGTGTITIAAAGGGAPSGTNTHTVYYNGTTLTETAAITTNNTVSAIGGIPATGFELSVLDSLGGDLKMQVKNKRASNASARSSVIVDVNGDAAGDADYSVTNGSTEYRFGLDNDQTGNPFVMTTGSSLGTNNFIEAYPASSTLVFPFAPYSTATTVIAGTTTLTNANYIVICNTAANFTITLPSTITVGKEFKIYNINTGIVTISAGSNNINGSTSNSIILDPASGTVFSSLTITGVTSVYWSTDGRSIFPKEINLDEYADATVVGHETSWNGSAWELQNGYRFARTSGLVTNSTTALADITGLSFPVTNGNSYSFKAIIRYSVNALTQGTAWSINGPAGSVSLKTASPVTTNTEDIRYQTGLNSNTPSTASPATSNNVCVIEGIVKPTANGTYVLRFAAEGAAASAVIVQTDSQIEWRQIN